MLHPVGVGQLHGLLLERVAYFTVPEVRPRAGRSFAELDLFFEKGGRARDFASARVDVFRE
ncbi:hypothetical protein C8R44DRAFT_865054 [Mycena epipterygia]|nr:hypothetical protein C8R44DRAFT_865054 [Mycena epipterygia]